MNTSRALTWLARTASAVLARCENEAICSDFESLLAMNLSERCRIYLSQLEAPRVVRPDFHIHGACNNTFMSFFLVMRLLIRTASTAHSPPRIEIVSAQYSASVRTSECTASKASRLCFIAMLNHLIFFKLARLKWIRPLLGRARHDTALNGRSGCFL